MIPDEFVNNVLNQNDITEIVGKYVHLTKQGRNLLGLCPFHSENTPSFTVSPDKQIFHCFGCAAGGNVIKFLMDIEGHSFPEAVYALAEEAGLPIEGLSVQPTQENTERNKLIEAHELAAKFFNYLLKNTDQGQAAMEYLNQRGFQQKSIDLFQIGYSPSMKDTLVQFLHKRGISEELSEKGGLISKRPDTGEYVDRFRDRIIFPIYDSKGKVIAFSGRALKDMKPKYLNSSETPIFNKRKLLYNLDKAKASMRKEKKAVLFEGFADVIKAWEAGVQNGVATMGTALSEQHAAMLRRYADEIIICYDGDSAGRNAAEKSISIFENVGLGVFVSVLPDQMDPDEYIGAYGSDKFRRLMIDEAMPATRFRLHHLKNKHHLQLDEGKLRYVHDALQIVAVLPSPTEREHYLKEISSEFDYSVDTLKQEMHQLRKNIEKNRMKRDNKEHTWNNVRNKRMPANRDTSLLPAFHQAEKYLLALMLQDREVNLYVQDQLGDQFNVEIHAALAAYLYAYYAKYEQLDLNKFLAFLQSESLENTVSAISMLDTRHAAEHPQVIDDYIHVIQNASKRHSILKQLKEEMKQAERAGDDLKAAEIAKEIIALGRQMKSL